jgi:murein endopeptidase
MPASFTPDTPPGRCGVRTDRARFRDTIQSFAARNRIAVQTFLALNHLNAQAHLVHRKRYVSAQGRFGERLVGGESLGPSNADLIVVNPSRAWGQKAVVEVLRQAAHRTQQKLPGPRLVVEDISMPQGGCMAPHREHRGGLEADVGLYHHKETRHLASGKHGSLDARREWYFLRTVLETGLVHAVLLDPALIATLRSEARRQKTPAELVSHWFAPGRAGIFTPAAGHDNHTHIKFRCPNDGCPTQPDLGPEIALAEEVTPVDMDEPVTRTDAK